MLFRSHNHPDKVRAQRKRYKAKHKTNFYIRKSKKHPFKITEEEYNKLFNVQEGKCRICGRHQSVLNKRLGVDHDHVTGKIRGLLCNNCNLILGHANDNVHILTEAIKYLQDTI